MAGEFENAICQMAPLLHELESNCFREWADLKDVPKQGIYVFYEKGKPMYVGRSNNMPRRIRQHGDENSRSAATFAYKRTLEATNDPGGHSSGKTRKDRMSDPSFTKEFSKHREKIRNMQVHTVKVEDQLAQTLFEIYAILKLKTTRYNKFHTT